MRLLFGLLLPRDEVTVPVVRHLFGSSLRNLGVDADCVSDLELAVTEACSNVLKHARVSDSEYEVSFQVDGASAEIDVANTGAAFTPPDAHFGSPPPGAEGGRGLLLMSHLVDQLHFERHDDETTSVRLRKRLTLTPDSVLRRLVGSAGGVARTG